MVKTTKSFSLDSEIVFWLNSMDNPSEFANALFLDKFAESKDPKERLIEAAKQMNESVEKYNKVQEQVDSVKQDEEINKEKEEVAMLSKAQADKIKGITDLLTSKLRVLRRLKAIKEKEPRRWNDEFEAQVSKVILSYEALREEAEKLGLEVQPINFDLSNL